MASEAPMTLKEVQVRLGVPQHVLIHLCEKGVVEPEVAETSGRGKRREFSRRNLFEFGVALALRRFELPVATAGLVIRVLRGFGRALGNGVPGVRMPDRLIEPGFELRLYVYDGERMVLSGRDAGARKTVLLGANIGGARGTDASPRVVRLDELPAKYEARLEIDLNEIARKTLLPSLRG